MVLSLGDLREFYKNNKKIEFLSFKVPDNLMSPAINKNEFIIYLNNSVHIQNELFYIEFLHKNTIIKTVRYIIKSGVDIFLISRSPPSILTVKQENIIRISSVMSTADLAA